MNRTTNWSDSVSAWGSSSPLDSYQLDELYGMENLLAGTNNFHMNHVHLLYQNNIHMQFNNVIKNGCMVHTCY